LRSVGGKMGIGHDLVAIAVAFDFDGFQRGREPVARHTASDQSRDQGALGIHPSRREYTRWHLARRFKMSTPSRLIRTVALMCLAITALPLRAQTKDAQDEGPVRRWGADAKAYVTAPLHAERQQW